MYYEAAAKVLTGIGSFGSDSRKVKSNSLVGMNANHGCREGP